MNRILSFSSVVIASSLFFSACTKVVGEGPVRTENRAAENFSGIDMRISGNVYYTQGSTYKLEVTAQQNILDVIETPVINNQLVIRIKNDVVIRRYDDIVVRVTAPMVSDLRISGSGNVQADKVSGSNNTALVVSGSGNMDIGNLTGNHLDATISGSGNVYVRGGQVATETLKVSGSGDIDVVNVTAKTVNSSTSGSGSMRVNATQNLDVTISGSGSVFYTGNPAINTHISGSGRIVRL